MARPEYTPPKPLTDTDLMPSGKYKDTMMQDVPASYLIYVYENNMCKDSVKEYVKENMGVLKIQAKKEKPHYED